MKPNANKPKVPESKRVVKPNTNNNLKSPSLAKAENKASLLPDDLSQTESQNQLTQDGPDEVGEKKRTPFQQFLNSLWGPIRG